jgi:hypothetical protein
LKGAVIFRMSRMSRTSIAKGRRTEATADTVVTAVEIVAVAVDVPAAVVVAGVEDAVAAAEGVTGVAMADMEATAAETGTEFLSADPRGFRGSGNEA